VVPRGKRSFDQEAFMDPSAGAIDYGAITERQQASWASGDFNELARQVMTVSAALIDAVDPHADQRVLDVACGSGNAALIAARRYCDVVGVDYVPSLVERAKVRAQAEGSKIAFQVGDAQKLDFPDASFDVIVSVFGIMFAPDQEKAAGEALRVCRPGGTIGICSWTPDGFGGDIFRAMGKYVPPPPGLNPPSRWGTDAGLAELLGAGTKSITAQRKRFHQYYRSVEHCWEVLSGYFGPLHRALQGMDAAERENVKRDYLEVLRKYNRATDGTAVLECEYFQAVAKRS
jgi:ubiquinone/menaquinone biosynthesis C-methylase UbiE